MKKILISLLMAGFCCLMAMDEVAEVSIERETKRIVSQVEGVVASAVGFLAEVPLERETKRIAGQVEGVVASAVDLLAEAPVEREAKRIVDQVQNKAKKLFGRFKK